VFLLVPAHPGSPGQRAVKRLLCCVVAVVVVFVSKWYNIVILLKHFTVVVGLYSMHFSF